MLPAGVTLVVSTLLAVHLLAQREASALNRTFAALLGSLALWTTGIIWRFLVESDAALWVPFALILAGIHLSGPIWLALAVQYVRVAAFEERPARVALFFVPPLVSYGFFLTNASHQLFYDEITLDALPRGPRVWAGPVFWMLIAWSYLWVAAATALYLGHTWQLRGTSESRHGVRLAVAAPIPIVCSFVYLFGLFPIPYDITSSGLAVTALILLGPVYRDRLFASLPLARRDVIERLREGVLLADAEGRILDLNPAASEILDRPDRALRGALLCETLASLAQDADRPGLQQSFRAMGPDDPPAQLLLHTPDERCIELTVACVAGRSVGQVGRYAVLRDRTDRHRTERMLLQAQKLESIGMLAAGVAHEVNNPLAFVRANLGAIDTIGSSLADRADVLSEKELDEVVELRGIVAETLDGVERITRIVDGLRRFSRQADEGIAPLDLNEVIQESLGLARLHGSDRIALHSDLAASLPRMVGSRDRMVQVFVNLLVNARQAVAHTASARIDVRSRALPGWSEVSIRDNGPGVPREVRERIFDPFFTTKGPDEGTGLGLAIAFDIVREHGGQLEVGDAPGGGAEFCIRLPEAPSSVAADRSPRG